MHLVDGWKWDEMTADFEMALNVTFDSPLDVEVEFH